MGRLARQCRTSNAASSGMLPREMGSRRGFVCVLGHECAGAFGDRRQRQLRIRGASAPPQASSCSRPRASTSARPRPRPWTRSSAICWRRPTRRRPALFALVWPLEGHMSHFGAASVPPVRHASQAIATYGACRYSALMSRRVQEDGASCLCQGSLGRTTRRCQSVLGS